MAEHTRSSITIEAAPAEVMAVISDFARYPEWTGEVKEAEILATDDQGRAERVRLVLDAGAIKDDHTLQYTWGGPGQVSWSLVKSQMLRTLDGSYTLVPVQGGKATEVTYQLTVDVKIPMLGMIKRKAQKRVITLESDVLAGYDPNTVVANVEAQIKGFKGKRSGVEIKMGGQQEEQKETASFLGTAMMASIGLIILILVTQFNSIGKPLIILSVILFSVIGVFLGLGIFGGNVSIVMTGVGVVALAGIVVRNGILIVEFIDILRERGMPLREAIIEAGKTRMTPVLLTATATILGLIPLAVGLNIDFSTLFSELNPHIFFGGDSVAFWGPLSWTMIYGLAFATILTLIVLPTMYMLGVRVKRWFGRKSGSTDVHDTHGQDAIDASADGH